jgi:hypothetical protein
MWRLTRNKNLPNAEISNDYEYSLAEPYNDEPNNLPNADVEYVQYGKIDNATREEELNDLYKDINQNGFPPYAEQKHILLKRYPEFNVNIKPSRKYGSGNSMLHDSIYQSSPGLAHAIINHPTISEETLEEELQYINSISKLNKSQSKIKQMIEKKLQDIRDYKPTAPPLENFEPSAPPLENFEPSVPPLENFEPSAPPLMTSYQIRNIDTGEISDIRNLPNVPSQAPPLMTSYQIRNLDTGEISDIRNLPNVPSRNPLNLPNVPKKSSSNIISRMIGRK